MRCNFRRVQIFSAMLYQLSYLSINAGIAQSFESHALYRLSMASGTKPLRLGTQEGHSSRPPPGCQSTRRGYGSKGWSSVRKGDAGRPSLL